MATSYEPVTTEISGTARLTGAKEVSEGMLLGHNNISGRGLEGAEGELS